MTASGPVSMTEPPVPTTGEADIASIGALLGDQSRCAILLALIDGRALPASQLAMEAGISAATASSHLGKLIAAGMITVEQHGRHRYHRLAGPDVAQLLELLQQLAPARPITSLRQGTRAQRLRAARTCYDHLAGRLGVAIMAAMIEDGLITGGNGFFDPSSSEQDHLSAPGHDIDYELTADGQAFLTDFGVSLPTRGRQIRYCVDWTEQRHHLAGPLGRGLRDRCTALGWIEPLPTHRAIRLTEAGRHGLKETFGPAVIGL